jgi:hypothetical protein
VKGGRKIKQSQLGEALHSLQVNNNLLHHQNSQLRTALATKRRRKAKSYTLDLPQRKEFYSDAILYSPATIREANWREKVKQDEAEAEKLQKKTARELKAVHNFYQKKMNEEAKALRESAAAARKKDAEARAAERAAEKERKQKGRDAATAQKSRDRPNKASRTTSQGAVKKSQRGGGAVGGASGRAPASPPPPPPTRTSRSGRVTTYKH